MFKSTAPLLIGLFLLTAASQFTTTAQAGKPGTSRISINSGSIQGNGSSLYHQLSNNGRYVVFSSIATNLVNNDTNGFQDIFRRDRLTGQTTRASIKSDGSQSNGDSIQPAISEDGRYITFASHATNLVNGDNNGFEDIFVHDHVTKQTTRVNVKSDGSQAVGGISYSPDISADGRYVTFVSVPSNLVDNDTNSVRDIFVHDRSTGQTTLVSTNSDTTQANSRCNFPQISSNGQYVVFHSRADNLTDSDTNTNTDIFVHDRITGQTTRASVSSNGTQAEGGLSYSASISSDGRYVAFTSEATNLVNNDNNGVDDIFVHDSMTGQTTRVSVSSQNIEADAKSYGADISADGRHISFASEATNLVNHDTNGKHDSFVRDLKTGETIRVSIASNGKEADSNSGNNGTSISADGHFVTFGSYATNLVDNDTNDETDIFIHGPLFDLFNWGMFLPAIINQ